MRNEKSEGRGKKPEYRNEKSEGRNEKQEMRKWNDGVME
jgi:hypothetical protein